MIWRRLAVVAMSLAMAVSLSTCTSAQTQTAALPATTPSLAAATNRSPAENSAESYRIVSAPDEIVSVLHNGATVICKRVPSPVAAVRGYCLTGGLYEGKWLGGGLSHLLEHLVAGGSCQRRSEQENRDLLEKIGNDSNAYTTYDHTAFFVNTTAPHLADAVDLVTGWMLGAKISPEEYARECQVVQRELERDKSDPQYVFPQLVQENRYKVSPARVPVIGYQPVIQGLSRDDVYSYYKIAYQPDNMVFSVSADLDPEKMLSIVRQYLAEAPPGRVFSHNIAAEPPVLSPRKLVATFPKLGLARLDLSFPSVTLTDPDMYRLDLLAAILGQGESSILVQELRDRQQFCSEVACYDETPAYVDGSFQVDLELPPDNIEPATKAVLAQIEKIKKDGVDEDRLQRAKAQVKVARLKSMQISQDIAASLATDFISTGDAHFSDLYVDRIAQVTGAEVQEAAKKYLLDNTLMTTALLPREFPGAQSLSKTEDVLRSAAATRPEEQAAASAPISRTELDNGIVLLHKRIATTPMIQIGMYALGGVTAEDAANNGIGNLAMASLRRGTTTRSADEIAAFFDTTGGDLATVCGNNTWYWTVSCTKDDFDSTMKVYGDVVNHPAFAPAQVDAVRSRVLAAIDSQDAAWDNQAFRYFKRQFYGPQGSPYQFAVLGTKENVSKFTPAQIQDWYQSKVLAAPRVLAVFGDISQEEAVAAARKYLATGGKLPPIPAFQAPAARGGNAAAPAVNVVDVKVLKTDQEVAAVVIGFKSKSVIGDDNQYAMDVAQCLTGGYSYPTGYIFEILRGRGLVYEAATINSPGRSVSMPGAFMAYAGCDPRNVNEVTNVILENIARLQGSDKDIDTGWFARCKELILTSDALQHETPAAQAAGAALDELYGLGYDHHAAFAGRIGELKVNDIRSLAQVDLRDCIVTVCTPDPAAVEIKPGQRVYETFGPVELTPHGVTHDVVPK